MKITEALLGEHAVFHNLFDYVEQTVPRLRTLVEIRSTARMLEQLLEIHSASEDELLIEPLEHCLEHLGQRENFHQEHDEIDGQLRLAQSARQITKARRHLLAAVHHSRKHFDKEERFVFPLAEKVMKHKTLESLGDSWRKHRKISGA